MTIFIINGSLLKVSKVQIEKPKMKIASHFIYVFLNVIQRKNPIFI